MRHRGGIPLSIPFPGVEGVPGVGILVGIGWRRTDASRAAAVGAEVVEGGAAIVDTKGVLDGSNGGAASTTVGFAPWRYLAATPAATIAPLMRTPPASTTIGARRLAVGACAARARPASVEGAAVGMPDGLRAPKA